MMNWSLEKQSHLQYWGEKRELKRTAIVESEYNAKPLWLWQSGALRVRKKSLSL